MAYTGFNKLQAELARKGVRDPGALAASIGRAKYGKRKFQHASATGHSLRGAKAMSPAARHKALSKYMRRHG